MGGDGIGGGEGVLKEKSNGVIDENEVVNGDKLSLEAIEEEEDVPIVDGVLNGALGAFGDMGLCFGDGVLASSCFLRLRFEKMPWKYLRLKMNEDDDDLKMRTGSHLLRGNGIKM
ncbi:hypothetical protein Tco_1170484, partial [Tanacetum coccineum]